MRHSVDHYFPILRDKAAEREAIAKLPKEAWAAVSPIFELVPTELLDILDQRLPAEIFFANSAARIRECSGAKPYIDIAHVTKYLTRTDVHPFKAFIDFCNPWRFDFIPVLRQEAKPETSYFELVTQHARSTGSGLCIRVTRNQVASPGFETRLSSLVEKTQLPLNEIDLIFDSGIVTSKDVDISTMISKIPEATGWRNLIYLGGSFPIDLSEGFVLGENYLDRKEWVNWKTYSDNLKEDWHLGYGDFVNQHPVFSMDRDVHLPTPSVRYATTDQWLVMKGAKVDGPKQYMAHAQLLVNRPEYPGPEFSFGDEYIKHIAGQLRKPAEERSTGNPTTWLKATINHQVVLTIVELRRVTEAVRKITISSSKTAKKTPSS
jgi:hypothetical protein